MTTERPDWIDALELPEQKYSIDEAYTPDDLRAFGHTVVAEYIARQEVVAWQYQWVYPGTTNTEWYALDLKGETLEDHVENYCKFQIIGNPKYEVRALCVKATK